MTATEGKLDVLIVDDERKACVALSKLLTEFTVDVNVVGSANSTAEALRLINEHEPDVVFLDIEMPKENAFQFLDRIKPFDFEVIFVTAYDEFAVRAFKLNAVDYLLKPVSITDLQSAVQNLRRRLHEKRLLSSVQSYSDLSNSIYNKTDPSRIVLRSGREVEVVSFQNIYYIEAQASYCTVVFAGDGGVKEFKMSYPLSEYEELLPENIFFRVHRSFLVNCLYIERILDRESPLVIVKGNYTLPISRRRYTALLEFLKKTQLM